MTESDELTSRRGGRSSRVTLVQRTCNVARQLHNFPAPMTQDQASRDFWCYVEGDIAAFQVTAPSKSNVDRLKKLIRGERHRVLRDLDPTDLVIWKVCESPTSISVLTLVCKLTRPVPLSPSRSIPERIQSLRTQFPDFAVELDDPSSHLSHEFPEAPLERHVHIFVQRPPGARDDPLYMTSTDVSFPSHPLPMCPVRYAMIYDHLPP